MVPVITDSECILLHACLLNFKFDLHSHFLNEKKKKHQEKKTIKQKSRDNNVVVFFLVFFGGAGGGMQPRNKTNAHVKITKSLRSCETFQFDEERFRGRRKKELSRAPRSHIYSASFIKDK